ncbi:MAG: hypothetical protein FD158_1849, partial [bacterium]
MGSSSTGFTGVVGTGLGFNAAGSGGDGGCAGLGAACRAGGAGLPAAAEAGVAGVTG